MTPGFMSDADAAKILGPATSSAMIAPSGGSYMQDGEADKLLGRSSIPDSSTPSQSASPSLLDTFKGSAATVASGALGVNASVLHTLSAIPGVDLSAGSEWAQRNAKALQEYSAQHGHASDSIVGAVEQGVGAAPVGLADWLAGKFYAAGKGALESVAKDKERPDISNSQVATDAIVNAGIEGAKRFGLGKVFDAIHLMPISQMKKVGIMSSIFGTQNVAEQVASTGTVDPSQVASSALTGAALGGMEGGGTADMLFQNYVKAGLNPKIARDLTSHFDPNFAPVNPIQDFKDKVQAGNVDVQDLKNELNIINSEPQRTVTDAQGDQTTSTAPTHTIADHVSNALEMIQKDPETKNTIKGWRESFGLSSDDAREVKKQVTLLSDLIEKRKSAEVVAEDTNQNINDKVEPEVPATPADITSTEPPIEKTDETGSKNAPQTHEDAPGSVQTAEGIPEVTQENQNAPEPPSYSLSKSDPIQAKEGYSYHSFDAPGEITGDSKSTSSDSPLEGAYSVEVKGEEGTPINSDTVSKVFYDPDIWASDKMVSRVMGDLKKLKEMFPNADLIAADTRGDGPPKVYRTGELGRGSLRQLRLDFAKDSASKAIEAGARPDKADIKTLQDAGLVEDPKAKVKGKVAAALESATPDSGKYEIKKGSDGSFIVSNKGLRGKDRLTAVDGKKYDTMEDARIAKAGLDQEVKNSGQPTVSDPPGTYYRVTKDDSSIITQDRAKAEAELGAGATVEKGELGANYNFKPFETVQSSPQEISVLKDMATLFGLNSERGSISGEKVDPRVLKEKEEARQRLLDKWNTLVSAAKSAGQDISDFLRSKGMSDSEIEQMKEGTKPPEEKAKVLSASQQGAILKRMLKMTPEESTTFNSMLTGVERMKDMSEDQRQKVLDSLKVVYKQVKGEDYVPKVGTRNKAPVHIQRDVNKAFVENALSARSAFGVKELGNRLMADGFSYLRGKGHSARTLAQRLEDIRTIGDINFENARANMREALKGISDTGKSRIVEILDTVKTGDIKGLDDSQRIKDAAQAIREEFNNVGASMEAHGMEISKLDGKKVPFTYDSESPYLPRYYDFDALQNPGIRREIALGDMVKKGLARNKAEAEVKLDQFISQKRNSPKFGNMEYAREFDVEGYSKDLHAIIDNYFSKSFHRLEVIKAFGQDDKGLIELLGGIKREDGDYVYSYGKDITKRITRSYNDTDTVGQKFVNGVTTFEVLTKMGRAGLKHLTQPANILGLAGIKNTSKALLSIMHNSGDAIDFATRSASLLHAYANEFAKFERGEDVSSAFVKATELGTEMTQKMFVWSGLKHIQLMGRIMAANTAKEYFKDEFKTLQTSTPGSGAYSRAMMRLGKMGADGAELLAKGGPDEFDLRRGAYKFTEQTYFTNDALTLPRWATSDSPWMRLVTLFHTFAYHQGQLVYRTMRDDPTRIAPMLGYMAVFGGLTSTALDTLQGKTREDEGLTDQVLRYIGSAAGFGVWGETLKETLKSPQGIGKALAGVVGSDVETKIMALKKGLLDDDWSALRKTMTRDIPIVGPAIDNRVGD